MTTITEFCQLTLQLEFAPIGAVGTGMRVDVPFTGTATSQHWQGERAVTGVDYVTIGGDGVQHLDIRARIGSGSDTVAYRAIGKGTEAGAPREVLVFETAAADLAFLNSAVGVATGTLEGTTLSLSVGLVDD